MSCQSKRWRLGRTAIKSFLHIEQTLKQFIGHCAFAGSLFWPWCAVSLAG